MGGFVAELLRVTTGVEPSTPGPATTSESPVGGAGDPIQPITSAPRSLATPSEEDDDDDDEDLGNRATVAGTRGRRPLPDND